MYCGCGRTISDHGQPPGNDYDPYNISIHGISPDDTVTAPTVPEIRSGINDLDQTGCRRQRNRNLRVTRMSGISFGHIGRA